MAADRLRDSMLPSAFSNVLSDFADLFQKELQLAKAEFSSKLTTKLRGGVWMLAASALFLLAGAIFSEALVIWITTFGIALHVACLIVAVVLLGLASVAFVAGRSDVIEDLTPTRSIHHIKEDIRTTKEQLS
jgi:type IV secretory pathway VirB6-like protein